VIISKTAMDIQTYLRDQMPIWPGNTGCKNMEIAVWVVWLMVQGKVKCQYRHHLPGTGESPVAPVYEDGEKTVTLIGEELLKNFRK